MRRSILKLFGSFLFPDAVMVLAAVGFLRPHGLPAWTLPLVQGYAYIVLAGGLVFGWYAAHSRVLYLMLLLIVSERVLHLMTELYATQPVIADCVFQATALLVPLNILGSALIPSKTIRRTRDLGLVILIMLQIALAAWICQLPDQPLAEVLRLPFIGAAPTAWTPLSQMALLTFLLGVILLTVRFFWSENRIDRGSVWALLCAFIAFQAYFAGWNPTNFLATAGLILITSLYTERYRELAYDTPTRLPSKHALDQALFEPGKVYAIALLEVDRLKELNLQYGYTMRNDVLRRVAEMLSEAGNPGKAFQFTDERFALFFRNQTIEQVQSHLKSVCARIAATSMPLPKQLHPLTKDTLYPSDGSDAKAVSITVSIGMAIRDEKNPKSQDVLTAAEKMLLRAKKSDGNQVKG